jgi:hypothetical protein
MRLLELFSGTRSGNITNNKHNATAQRGPSKHLLNNRFNQSDLYIVPEQLIHDVLVSVTSATTR